MSNKRKKLVLGSSSKNNIGSEAAEIKQMQVNRMSDLSYDVLKLIFTRLNWVDRIRLCGISKNFASVLHQIPSRPMERLPWLMTVSYKETNPSLKSLRSTITYPSSSRTYNVEIDEKFGEYMLHRCTCYSRHGWLVSWQRFGEYYDFSLYRPYNKKIVVLPKFPYRRYSVGGGVTLSMDPTSLEYCLFYVRVDESMLTLDISMCHIGDSNWSYLKFDLPADQNEPTLEDVICEDGYLYCVLDGGQQLGILDIAKQELNFFTDCMVLPPALYCSCQMHVAVFNGDLFLLYWKCSRSEFICLWRFDNFLKQWVRQESLGNSALFFGRPSLLVEAVGELSPYANTIHNVFRRGPNFASFSGGEPAVGALYPAQGDDLQQRLLQCWIDPPPLISPK